MFGELFFDTEELVVFGDTVGAGDGACFDLADAGSDGEVGDEVVGGFAAAVGDDGGVAVLASESDGVEGFGEGADLVEFDQDGVGGAAIDALLEAGGVGDEEVVADELYAVAEGIGEGFEAVPIVFGESVFDGDDRVAVAEVDVIGDSFGRIDLFLIEVVFAVFEERACGGVEGEGDVFSGQIASFFDGEEDEFEGFFVVGEVGSKAAFVADVGIEFASFEDFFEDVEDLGGGAEGITEGGCADGHDHKLLDIESVVGVFAAVDDVAHGGG